MMFSLTCKANLYVFSLIPVLLNVCLATDTLVGFHGRDGNNLTKHWSSHLTNSTSKRIPQLLIYCGSLPKL